VCVVCALCFFLGSLSRDGDLVSISVLGVSTAYSVFETLRLVTAAADRIFAFGILQKKIQKKENISHMYILIDTKLRKLLTRIHYHNQNLQSCLVKYKLK